MITAAEIKDYARSLGADIVGIGDTAHVPASYPARPPQRLMPQAKRVISFGMGMLNGTLDSGNWNIAAQQASMFYHELPFVAHRVGRLIEKAGYHAAIVGPSSPQEITKETRGMVGEVSHRHCAVAAGLGILGKNRLLITREFGPRVNLATLITDAPLEADQPLTDSLCSDCRICIDTCPAGALSEDGKTDTKKCLQHVTLYGMTRFVNYLSDMVPKPAEEQQKALKDLQFYQFLQHITFGLSYNCISCARECPAGR